MNKLNYKSYFIVSIAGLSTRSKRHANAAIANANANAANANATHANGNP